MRHIAEEATAAEVTKTTPPGMQQQQVHSLHIMILCNPIGTQAA